ncbi:MAG: DUF2007 domain-containing protein [Candidatus Omnitrophota bacterium]
MDKSESEFITVCSTNSLADLAFIKSLLDSEGIKYFIKNENLRILYGAADGFTLMDIQVLADKIEDARELLKDFIGPKK